MFGTTNSDELSQLPDVVTGSLTRGRTDRCKVQVAIDTPEALAGLESFAAGDEYAFAYWYDEIHVVVGGSAHVAYTLPPFHQEVHEREVVAGDTYLIPNGSRWWWQIGADEPFLHYFTVMPNVFYKAHEAL